MGVPELVPRESIYMYIMIPILAVKEYSTITLGAEMPCGQLIKLHLSFTIKPRIPTERSYSLENLY